MSYAARARIAEDIDVINRIAACAATRGVASPVGWVSPRSWYFAALDGWDTAYLSATGDRPGLDESGITDEMIRIGVDDLLSTEADSNTGGES